MLISTALIQDSRKMQTASSASNNKLRTGNLILVGMPGSGKTTMGRLLAKHLCKTFIDSDEEIQKRTGVSIRHIFDLEGESGFRCRETSTIKDLVQQQQIVLATGGGAVLRDENREALSQHGIVIYLKATVHDLWYRTRHDKNRPLLQTADPKAKLTELFEQRDPLYTQVADIVVPSGRQGVNSLMLYLVKQVEFYQTQQQELEACKH